MTLEDVLWLALILSAPLIVLVAGGLWAIRATRRRREPPGRGDDQSDSGR